MIHPHGVELDELDAAAVPLVVVVLLLVGAATADVLVTGAVVVVIGACVVVVGGRVVVVGGRVVVVVARVVVVLCGLLVVVEDSEAGGRDVVVLLTDWVELTIGCDTLGPPDPHPARIRADPTRSPTTSSRRVDLVALSGTLTSVRSLGAGSQPCPGGNLPRLTRTSEAKGSGRTTGPRIEPGFVSLITSSEMVDGESKGRLGGSSSASLKRLVVRAHIQGLADRGSLTPSTIVHRKTGCKGSRAIGAWLHPTTAIAKTNATVAKMATLSETRSKDFAIVSQNLIRDSVSAKGLLQGFAHRSGRRPGDHPGTDAKP
jgi:hypothetical protein